jgi:hypothetical protein
MHKLHILVCKLSLMTEHVLLAVIIAQRRRKQRRLKEQFRDWERGRLDL